MGPSKTYAETVYHRLREDILSGAAAPGQRLAEIEIAQRMGTSQGPVREALARLRAEGVVITLPHRGSFVSEISAEEARDAYDVRYVLERHALRLALPLMQEHDFQALETEIRRMARAAKRGRVADNITHDMRFHRLIYQRAASPTLLQLWDVIEMKIRKFAAVVTPPVFTQDPLRGVNSHYPLLEQMRAGYSIDLEAELERHLSLIWMTSAELATTLGASSA